MNRFLIILMCTMVLPMAHSGEENRIPADQLKFFETKIRPALADHCYKCHSAKAKKIGGKLLLD
ncbi:MAG: hypothetical protein P1V20_05105, partial [Verrucomicrobiales bacterium]|nr:hypothetical protein [Verrucomicrobiales bacterium]